MRVSVYFNLHRRLFSLRGPGGRVIDHRADVALRDVTFRVQAAGQARVRSSGQKNVHAFVTGTLVDAVDIERPQRVTYDPYADDTFVTGDGAAITSAPAVRLCLDGGKSLILAGR